MQAEWDEEKEPEGYTLVGKVAAKPGSTNEATNGDAHDEDDSDDELEIVTDDAETDTKKRKREDDTDLSQKVKKANISKAQGTDAEPIALD